MAIRADNKSEEKFPPLITREDAVARTIWRDKLTKQLKINLVMKIESNTSFHWLLWIRYMKVSAAGGIFPVCTLLVSHTEATSCDYYIVARQSYIPHATSN